MINEIFKEIDKSNLLDWGVIFFGCQGLPIGRISAINVSNYSSEELMVTPSTDENFGLIAELSFCDEITEETIEILKKICEIKQIDLTMSKQKWLFFALKKLIDNLPDDVVYGPLKLNEFWYDWGELQNSPNLIQGVDNNITPNEFYSEENFKRIIYNHKLWLEKEAARFKVS